MSELRTVTDRGRLRQVSNRNLHNSDTPGNIVYALKPSRRSFFKEADYCIMIKKKKILTFLSETLHLITKHFDKKHLGIPAAPLRWRYKYSPCLCNLRVNWQEIQFCKWALGQFWSYVKCKIRALCMEKKKKSFEHPGYWPQRNSTNLQNKDNYFLWGQNKAPYCCLLIW